MGEPETDAPPFPGHQIDGDPKGDQTDAQPMPTTCGSGGGGQGKPYNCGARHGQLWAQLPEHHKPMGETETDAPPFQGH